MATVNKDFKIKHGLIVEGTTGTINGEDILTKAQVDIDYIIDQVGGSGESTNTPNTLVLRDGSGNFAAGTITADLTGDVTGTVSDISNHDTDDLSEGTTNKYYTDDRVKNVLTGSTQTNIQISEIGGVLHITAENGVADSTTDDLDEGTTNKYFTDARARQAISEGNGINYDSNTGIVSADLGDFDTDDLTEGATNKYFTTTRIDDHLSGGDGITYSSGTISADLGTGLEISGGQIVVDRTETDTWYDANGAAGDVATDLSTHEGLSSGVHGVTGSVVGTSDIQTLTNKTIGDILTFNDGSNNSTIDVDGNDLYINANNNLTLSTANGDIVLNPDGTAYVGSASAGNEIATNSYVDNAVSGLDWKNAVNMIAFANVPVSGSTPLSIDNHTADNGYRILLTEQTTDSENGIYDVAITGGSYTLSRSSDSDAFAELVGAAVFVMEGDQYGQTSWVQSNHYLSDFSSQNWTQFSGSGSVVAGTGITVDGLEVSVDRTTVDTWYEPDGAVSTHSGLTTGVHGVNGDIVGTSDSQTLTNKTIDASSNTLSNIANSSLTNSSIDINGYTTSLGGSVTLDTDDVSEGTNQYFTSQRVQDVLTGAALTNIQITSVGGALSITAENGVADSTTDDLDEGLNNKYFTDGRVKDVLTASTQSNISITNVAGELIITAENGVADSTTDDLDEGTTNHYFTDERAKIAAADLLVNHSTKTNITITGDETGLTITAENGVADSNTDQLSEGSTNLYFTNQRAVDALEAVVPNFTAVELNSVAKQIAATVSAPTGGSQITAYSFAKADYRSAKFLVKTAYGTHTELSEVLITLDSSDNIAITEYAIVGTNGSSMAITADVDGTNVRLRVTPVNNNSTVTVIGTLVA